MICKALYLTPEPAIRGGLIYIFIHPLCKHICMIHYTPEVQYFTLFSQSTQLLQYPMTILYYAGQWNYTTREGLVHINSLNSSIYTTSGFLRDWHQRTERCRDSGKIVGLKQRIAERKYSHSERTLLPPFRSIGFFKHFCCRQRIDRCWRAFVVCPPWHTEKSPFPTFYPASGIKPTFCNISVRQQTETFASGMASYAYGMPSSLQCSRMFGHCMMDYSKESTPPSKHPRGREKSQPSESTVAII